MSELLTIETLKEAIGNLKELLTPTLLIETPLLNDTEYLLKSGNKIYCPSNIHAGEYNLIELPEIDFSEDKFEVDFKPE